LKILLAATLSACVGLAIVASQIADLVLGPNFRTVSHAAMPGQFSAEIDTSECASSRGACFCATS
jgi:hypothetical protein